MHHATHERVVPADDRDVTRDDEPHLVRDAEPRDSEHVAVVDDRRRALRARQELPRDAGTARRRVVAVDDVSVDAQLGGGLLERLVRRMLWTKSLTPSTRVMRSWPSAAR